MISYGITLFLPIWRRADDEYIGSKLIEDEVNMVKYIQDKYNERRVEGEIVEAAKGAEDRSPCVLSLYYYLGDEDEQNWSWKVRVP